MAHNDYKGKRYRLAFIDAPELSQNIVGQLSKKHLEGIIDITIKTQRKPTYFSRWMNLVNNFLLGICICRNNIVYL